MHSSNQKIFENFSAKINAEGFYEITVFNDKEFSFPQLEELKEAQESFGAKKLSVLVLCEEYASTDTSFLNYLAKNKNNPYSNADAFVIKSIAQKLIANFYIKIVVPERPTKFFNNRNDAYQWIKQFVE